MIGLWLCLSLWTVAAPVVDDVATLRAAVAERGADAVYPEILTAIDDGNLTIAQLLTAEDRAVAVPPAISAQRRRSDLRLEVFAQLSPTAHHVHEGLSTAALDQLRREARQVTLEVTALVVVTLPTMLEQWREPTSLQMTSLLVHLGLLLLTALGAALIANRGEAGLRHAQVWLARTKTSRAVMRAGTTLLGALAALWGPLMGIVAVAIVGAIVDDIAHFGAVVVALVWARGWAWLRLGVAVVVQLIRWLAATPLGGLSPATTQRVTSSVRFAGRAALVIVVAVTISEITLGRGALYTLSTRATWVAVVVVAVVLLRRWQADIARRYLELRPTGPLADAVRGSQHRWFGFFVGLTAFLFVVVQAMSSLVRRFLLGFDQTRKALAFIFRRRLEREARNRGFADDAARPLPAAVTAVLAEDAAADVDTAVDRFAADITRLRASIDRWRADHDRVGAAVLVGLPGHGKSTWLRAALRDIDFLPRTSILLRGRLHSVQALHRTIAAALRADIAIADDVDDLDGVIAALRADGRQRLIVIDDLHNLLLRGDPDRRVWRAFEEFIRAAAAQAYVVATIDTLAEQHLRWANVDVGHIFRERFILRSWTDAEIEALLTARLRRSGHHVRYDDLLVARVDDAERDLRLMATAQEYARLIWDFAEGSPAVALDAWRRSLHLHDDGYLHVRLFRQPDERQLEVAGQTARFVLAAVAWNENVTVEEAARSLAVPVDVVEAILERFREQGVLLCEQQRYRIATSWWSMVWRFLRRKHLITA